MLPLGTIAPNFLLNDPITTDTVSLQHVRGDKGTVVMFLSNHCPYVKHINDEIVRTANDYHVTGFGFVAISSNDIKSYPQDSPMFMRETARKEHYSFPYLYDETQEIKLQLPNRQLH